MRAKFPSHRQQWSSNTAGEFGWSWPTFVMWMGFTSHQVLVRHIFLVVKITFFEHKIKSTSTGLQRSLVPSLSDQWGGRVHNFLGWEWTRGKRTTFTTWKSANFHSKSSADWFLELPLAGGPVHHHLPNVLGLSNQGNAFGRLLPHRLQLLLIVPPLWLYLIVFCILEAIARS